MKQRLENNGEWVEIQLIGRSLFVNDGGVETMRNLFDDDEAKAEADALVAARIAAGWREPASVIAARVEAERASAALATRLHALAELAGTDPIGALQAFTDDLFEGASFQRLLERVEVIEDIDAHGFVIRFRGGATASWVATPEQRLTRLWLYLDPAAAARNDHHLFYGDGAGPPEGDAQLAGTAFEGTEVHWFLQEVPWDRYWFVADGVAHCYELDGGLHDDVRNDRILDLVAERIVWLLDRRGVR